MPNDRTLLPAAGADMAAADGRSADGFLQRGTASFRHASLALGAAGFATFASLYCVQPLLPLFSQGFGVSPAGSSLSLSLSTAVLALSMLVAGPISERVGRARPMMLSMFATASLTLLAAAAPSWGALLAVRTLLGVALSGVPAIAMAYLAEEVEPRSVPAAMGIYVGSTALGGMSGRLLTGVVVDLSSSWRLAMAVTGLLSLVAAGCFWRWLPPSRRFQPSSRGGASAPLASYLQHLRDPGLRRLFGTGFLLMGAFVTMYNYAGYHLMAPPFSLSEAAVGAIFLVYLIGIPASPAFGRLAGRFGRPKMIALAALLILLGVAMSLSAHLWLVITGVTVITAGFFGGHAVASSGVGARARFAKAQAASLYLFFYYVGSSVIGTAGGLFWSALGWPGVTAFVAVLATAALVMAVQTARDVRFRITR